MRRFILGILFLVMASDPTQACSLFRDEYTSDKEFYRKCANLNQVPDDIPDEAIEVDLTINKITRIPINAFSNLRDCQTLLLSLNQLYEIESGMFNGLNSLIFLNLAANKITTLGDDAFSGLSSLNRLEIESNKITTISEKMFSSLQACTELFLYSNNISTIPERAFASLRSPKRISVSGNGLLTIQANAFPNNLERLDIARNKISDLNDAAYTSLVSLKYLELRYNSISTIPANAFSTLSNCKTLELYSNPIKTIEAGAFHGLDKLTRLDLSNISRSHLSQNMFEGLPSLQVLKLDDSRISIIARGAFTSLNQLLTLSLYKNELTVIESYTFSGLVSLKSLFLHKNNINDIKDFAVLSLGNLTNLYLYNNQLEHLRPNTFAGLVSLEFLDLGDNKLTTLDPFVLSPLKRPLELALDVRLTPSSVVCDMRLCWLKMEEEAGNVVWSYRLNYNFFQSRSRSYTGVYYPNCTAGVEWQSFQCPATIPCRDPGQVEFAERSGSFLPLNNNAQPGLDLPYSTDTVLRYTCDPCYTGGGTISCQSNGQWTRKPECVRLDNNVVCRAPSVIDGYLTPSYDQYDCGVKVTFTCNQGSTQTVGACGPDGEFIGGISSCEQNGEMVPATGGNGTETASDSPSQGTKPESEGKEGGSSGLIYGIVGAAVGGIVVTVLIGLTIYCVKRSKKKKRSDAETVNTQNTAADSGYAGLVLGVQDRSQGQGHRQNTQPDRGTPQQTVRSTRDEPEYNNRAYENVDLELRGALPKDDPYEHVYEHMYEN